MSQPHERPSATEAEINYVIRTNQAGFPYLAVVDVETAARMRSGAMGRQPPVATRQVKWGDAVLAAGTPRGETTWAAYREAKLLPAPRRAPATPAAVDQPLPAASPSVASAPADRPASSARIPLLVAAAATLLAFLSWHLSPR